ncbi:Oligopeptide transport ATP-binding protein OppF [Burkholderiales bacterium]|nr:Oligopeptide transport ATP-binding protein OppF [Burkholderiales bacterium]
MNNETADPLLVLTGITKRFVKRSAFAERLAAGLSGGRAQDQVVHAVDGVDLNVGKGEVVALVGESGCGKSTLGRVVAGVHEASSGVLSWKAQNVDEMSGAERKAMALAIQMIFQDPMSSLNPRKRVREIVSEAPLAHGLIARAQIDDYVAQMLGRVGLDPAYMHRYPHQFSGGQRQRIGIARALAVEPEFLVCDEAVAALDVSIQAQVINLFMQLRDELHLTYLFISHDLGVVQHIADRVLVMYLGRIVESAPAEEVFARPAHPYAQALLNGVPRITVTPREYAPIRGEIPSPLHPPGGCHFHPRCPLAQTRCTRERPALRALSPAHGVACHFAP